MEVSKIFFFKGTELLIKIKNTKDSDNYALRLSKMTKLGYARVNQLLCIFKKLKLIEFVKLSGRTNGVILTKKGKETANNLERIIKTLTP